MEKIVLYEDPNVRLEHVEDGNYIHETWWGLTPKQVFTEILKRIIHLVKETGASGLLLDAREHMGLDPESQKLAATEIEKLAKEIGGLREAIIVPKDVFSKFSVQSYANKMENKDRIVNTRFFDSMENAEEWLRENIG